MLFLVSFGIRVSDQLFGAQGITTYGRGAVNMENLLLLWFKLLGLVKSNTNRNVSIFIKAVLTNQVAWLKLSCGIQGHRICCVWNTFRSNKISVDLIWKKTNVSDQKEPKYCFSPSVVIGELRHQKGKLS